MHKIQTNKLMNGFIDNKRHPFKQDNQKQLYIIQYNDWNNYSNCDINIHVYNNTCMHINSPTNMYLHIRIYDFSTTCTGSSNENVDWLIVLYC